MTDSQKMHALMPLIRLATAQAQALPPAQRADIYEGIALAIGTASPAMADEARATCESLRAAEIQQLTFATLLRS